MSPLASLFVLAAVVFLGIAFTLRAIRRAPEQPAEPSSLDIFDGIESCSTRRPHRMLPTEYGWKCANDCGERWFVDPADELATADLALWEIELAVEA